MIEKLTCVPCASPEYDAVPPEQASGDPTAIYGGAAIYGASAVTSAPAQASGDPTAPFTAERLGFVLTPPGRVATETAPTPTSNLTRVVGTSVPRKEGREKVLGKAVYIDDMSLPGMWHGATVRSTIPRGKILSIRLKTLVPWDEYVVVTAEDINGQNFVPLFKEDQPFLADGIVNHPEEPIMLIAHPRKEMLAVAVAAVSIEYAPLPNVLNLADSDSQAQIVWGEDNVFKHLLLEKGDVDAVWDDPRVAFVVEGEYETGAQEQLYIEPNGVIAQADDGGVTVWGSMQCPFYVHRALKTLFGMEDGQVRVIQTETGGAFGGKEEYPSILAGHAALLARKAGRPVKIVYDRCEDMAATTKRHPSRTRHRTAVDKDGRLLGGEIEFVIDGGAYATLSEVVLSRGTIHAGGPYRWPSIRIRSRAVATNTPPSGAFRGFGAPQSIFAMERHMDRIAKEVGISPAEIRRRNFLHQGDTTATGQVVRDPIDLAGMMDRVLAQADTEQVKGISFGAPTRTSGTPVGGPHSMKGVGIAAFFHGAGFTGSGERYLQSRVGLEATAEGKVRILVSSTEFGQGTNTILCQIAAEALGCRYEDVEIARPDTSRVPNSGPTVASRTAMIVGKLVENAARAMRQTLRNTGFVSDEVLPSEFAAACREYLHWRRKLTVFTQYESPPDVFWDDVKYRGEAYPAYAWSVHVAKVTVDPVTYTPTVDRFLAIQEIGKVLHPVLAAGQIEGGIAQGIGFALYEKVVWQDGRMANGQMTNYIMPTSADLPPIEVMFEELPYAYGAFGAKGIGELPMDGPAPAILNAIAAATGLDFNTAPLMPEDVFRRMSGEGL